jgi:hypothetical protein
MNKDVLASPVNMAVNMWAAIKINFELEDTGEFIVEYFTDFGAANKAFGGLVRIENNNEVTLDSGMLDS